MADEQLYTLRQLADQLGLPESTVRYYRDAFLDHIPSVGTGRRRRYPAQAAQVLKSIAKSYAAGRPRTEIIAAITGKPNGAIPAVAVASEPAPQGTVSVEEVSNLDLLAAILDGEREQRDALWQMAKEIVRLTEVLDGQDQVLTQIASQAGVAIEGRPMLERKPQSMLSSPATPAADTPAPAPAPAPIAETPASPSSLSSPSSPSSPPVFTPFRNEPAPAVIEHADESHHDLVETAPLPRSAMAGPSGSASGDLEKLKAELEAERALVERLRESRLQLEHRAADAEAALEEREKRRPSVIRRMFGGSGEA